MQQPRVYYTCNKTEFSIHRLYLNIIMVMAGQKCQCLDGSLVNRHLQYQLWPARLQQSINYTKDCLKTFVYSPTIFFVRRWLALCCKKNQRNQILGFNISMRVGVSSGMRTQKLVGVMISKTFHHFMTGQPLSNQSKLM